MSRRQERRLLRHQDHRRLGTRPRFVVAAVWGGYWREITPRWAPPDGVELAYRVYDRHTGELLDGPFAEERRARSAARRRDDSPYR